LRDVAATAIERALAQPSQISSPEALAIDHLARTSGFDAAVDRARTVASVSHFETETGFAVIGATIAEVAVSNGTPFGILAMGDRYDPGVVRVNLSAPACSIAIRFGSDRGTALPVLRGYICHVLVDGNSVTNVSYVPSDNSSRWQGYASRRGLIENLRAASAAAVKMGVFRLDDKQRASDLADHIRAEKAFDPVLGLFACYAYSEADQREDIESVRGYMHDDLSVDLFDVAMLARRMSPLPGANYIVPFCPMLSQGWNFLRARGVMLPKVLDDAQDELERALWTTFKPDRIKLIIAAMKRGEIT
jgi:hypothetical protein